MVLWDLYTLDGIAQVGFERRVEGFGMGTSRRLWGWLWKMVVVIE
jgi:hypothetical protein